MHELVHIAARLKIVREALNYSQTTFSVKLSCSLRGYQANELGRSMPGGKVLSGLFNLGVNVNWLLSGEGEMLLNDAKKLPRALEATNNRILAELGDEQAKQWSEANNKDIMKHIRDGSNWLFKVANYSGIDTKTLTYEVFKTLIVDSETKAEEENEEDLTPCRAMVEGAIKELKNILCYTTVPLYNVELLERQSVLIDYDHNISQIAFRTDWIAKKQLDKHHLATIKAQGDSMEPTISDGDILLVDTQIKQITGDAIYIIKNEGHLVAKRIQQNFDGSINIISDNKIYSEETIPKDSTDKILIAGRVVWNGHEI